MRNAYVWPAILVAAAIAVAAASLLMLPPPAQTLGQRPPASAPAEAVEGNGAPRDYFDSTAAPSGSIAQPINHFPAENLSPSYDVDKAGATPWQRSIDQLLESSEDNDAVATSLGSLLPSLPPEAKVEALQHMVNLLSDEKYSLASRLLLDPAIAPDQRDIIFSDVVDRPDNIKLPVLIAILGVPGHPLRTEARENLAAVIGSDFGENEAAWGAASEKWLAKQAAEQERDILPEEAAIGVEE